ncbi:hypothetical protein ACL5HQ_20105 [Stenotrophomonas maltophilia]|uniref:hypothetical protein n=1 Tax=Stenotrophomonas sp. GD04024 TaxID=2975422 RepID=UPI00244AB6F2|nr:hypothetical protein [Stenotrophomonas sp. GD04024]MDG9986832.1 hypothetical protein [Stenotrophomonas sp. GD04024]
MSKVIEEEGGGPPAELSRPQPAKRSEFRAALWISLVLLLALVGVLLWKMAFKAAVPQTQAEAKAEQAEAAEKNLLDAVERCDKRYAQMNSDRQYTTGDLRVYAQLCKNLRDDYKAKWGREP